MMMMMMTMMTVKMRPELLTEKVINIHKQTFATSDTYRPKEIKYLFKTVCRSSKEIGNLFFILDHAGIICSKQGMHLSNFAFAIY